MSCARYASAIEAGFRSSGRFACLVRARRASHIWRAIASRRASVMVVSLLRERARPRARSASVSASLPVVYLREGEILPARRLLLDQADAVHVLGPQHAPLRRRREDRARLPDDGDQLVDGDLLLGDADIDF